MQGMCAHGSLPYQLLCLVTCSEWWSNWMRMHIIPARGYTVLIGVLPLWAVGCRHIDWSTRRIPCSLPRRSGARGIYNDALVVFDIDPRALDLRIHHWFFIHAQRALLGREIFQLSPTLSQLWRRIIYRNTMPEFFESCDYPYQGSHQPGMPGKTWKKKVARESRNYFFPPTNQG